MNNSEQVNNFWSVLRRDNNSVSVIIFPLEAVFGTVLSVQSLKCILEGDSFESVYRFSSVLLHCVKRSHKGPTKCAQWTQASLKWKVYQFLASPVIIYEKYNLEDFYLGLLLELWPSLNEIPNWNQTMQCRPNENQELNTNIFHHRWFLKHILVESSAVERTFVHCESGGWKSWRSNSHVNFSDSYFNDLESNRSF